MDKTSLKQTKQVNHFAYTVGPLTCAHGNVVWSAFLFVLKRILCLNETLQQEMV